MDPVTAGLIVEFVRLATTTAFTLAKLNGVSEEELDKIFKEEFQKVKERKPEDLPDV